MNKWEYLTARFTFKGRGITQEFQTLDVDGERLHSYGKENPRFVDTLPAFLAAVGDDSWELVSHSPVYNPSTSTNEQFMTFKRPKTSELLSETPEVK